MNDFAERIEELAKDLNTEREKLRVQLHLAKMEASDEWQDLEEKFSRFESKTEELGGAAAEASKEIAEAAKLLGQEIAEGFKKVANKLKD